MFSLVKTIAKIPKIQAKMHSDKNECTCLGHSDVIEPLMLSGSGGASIEGVGAPPPLALAPPLITIT